MSNVADGLRLAWGTLTALPGPPPGRVDQSVARVAMSLGWLVVLPVMVAAAAAGWGLTLVGVPALASGFITVALVQLATRAIHADGLADTADGLGSGRPRDQALDIMRRGDVGPMGVTALVLVFGLQAVLLGDLLARPWGWLFAALALAAGRLALASACSAQVPSARPEGLGAAVAGSVPTWLVTTLHLGMAIVGMMLADLLGTLLGADVPRHAWVWAFVIGMVLSTATLGLAIRKLGGITGDVLGAVVEVMTLGLLLGLAIR
ncbi:MAG: adenosylcobinamide-GDP ribazoletransferase [Propionibacteriaceae bacterium]|nr:adenosylcobinamide-GDP ribazoletransferase [Propionibacteriaceae bacterium]